VSINSLPFFNTNQSLVLKLVFYVYSFPIFPANVSINLPIGPLIIMAIIGLKSPSKSSLTALDVSETASILATNVNGSLSLAAPKTILEGATFLSF
jgi:hypothetical protein